MNQVEELNQSPRVHEITSDSTGDWDIIVDNDLPAGAHIVSVEDEQGNIDQAIMYVVKSEPKQQTGILGIEPVIIEKITTIVPASMGWFLMTAAVMIMVLSAVSLFFAKKAENKIFNLSNGETAKPKHYLRYVLIICSIFWLLIAGVGLFMNREINFLSFFFAKSPIAVEQLKGQVLHPLERTTVSGIDLVYLNSSIRTADSGYYTFYNINVGEGIKLTYRGLLRPLVFLPQAKEKQESLDILFDLNLYNQLIKVVDTESRGRYNNIYNDYLQPEIKEKISEADYINNYQSSLTPKNVNDQELLIKNVEIKDKFKLNDYNLTIDKVVIITVLVNDQEIAYPWQYLNDNWYLIK
jgi:hypothetical protein